MNIFGIGVDMVEISRITNLRQKQGENFYNFIFTSKELEYCLKKKNSDESFAARFAAKEAVMKALGTGWTGGINFKDIEVVKQDDRRPEIIFHNKALEFSEKHHISYIHLSLSHTKEFAIAYAIAML